MTRPVADALRQTLDPPAAGSVQAPTASAIPTVTAVTLPAATSLAANAPVQAATTATAPQITVRSDVTAPSPAATAVAEIISAQASDPQQAPPAQLFSFINTIKPDEIHIEQNAELGSGGTGKVFLGRWGKEKVALKRLALYYEDEEGQHEIDNDYGGETLQWEMSRMASACHPNVVEFHGLWHKDGKTYLVMELCEHGDLEGALKKGGIGNDRLWQWMAEISAGLAYLHGQGMLHRDIKAENVLIDANGRAKLADLGLAQVDALLERKELDAVAAGMQTATIIAPENRQADEGRYNSKASDMYALGLLFWRMVHQGTEPDFWWQVTPGASAPIPADCPAALRDLILSCCHPDPQQRAGIEAVQQQLRNMGPLLHADHALVLLAGDLEQALHGNREALRAYVPAQVTERRIEGSMEQYWQRWEKAGTATTSTATTTSASPPTAAPSAAVGMPNAPLALQAVFERFLADADACSLLLLGDGGLGKTLSTHVLAGQLLRQWWRHWSDPTRHPRPPFLPLLLRAHIDDWRHDKLANACSAILGRYGSQATQTPLLVIVDGYDECISKQDMPANLASHLGLPSSAKLLVSCRPDAVPEEQWRARFGIANKLQTCHFLPFAPEESLAYLKRRLGWDEATYQGHAATLRRSEQLRAILGNPFLLFLLAQSWDSARKAPLEELTRSKVYAGFIEHAIDTGRVYLAPEVQAQLQAGHVDLVSSYQAFLRRVALRACEGRGTTLAQGEADSAGMAWSGCDALAEQAARRRYREREDSHARLSAAERKEAQRRRVLTQEDFVRLQQQTVEKLAARLPLRQRSGGLEFIHQSVFEYCTAQQLLCLMDDEAESMTEEALAALLTWLRDTLPEVLLFLEEAMAAMEGSLPESSVKQAGNRIRFRSSNAELGVDW